MLNKLRLAFAVFSFCAIQGCAGMKSPSGPCTSTTSNASYTGPYMGVENKLKADDLARDAYCAIKFKAQKYPAGFVAIYGSSRIGEDSPQADPTAQSENGRLYQGVRQFANQWTRQYGGKYPILTGAGPGIMEAGNRGAIEAGGPSIGYTTYYGPARDKNDARLAFQQYKDANGMLKDIMTDGLVFTSLAIRESMMIAHSAAIIIAPGGTGTEWETFQIIESLKSQQLDPVPVFLVGNRDRYWKSFDARLREMAALGTIRTSEVANLFVYVENAADVVPLLQKRLNLPPN
jgi:predicted Rossmann-fold nucleotide-binding protein